jgi:predicted ribosomally synthesized peptide with nif11-like leader
VAKTSKKGAKQFVALVDKDPEVREAVREAAGAILAVAKERGYKFTGKQLQAYLRKKWGIPDESKDGPKKPKGVKGLKASADDSGDGPMTTWCW